MGKSKPILASWLHKATHLTKCHNQAIQKGRDKDKRILDRTPNMLTKRHAANQDSSTLTKRHIANQGHYMSKSLALTITGSTGERQVQKNSRRSQKMKRFLDGTPKC